MTLRLKIVVLLYFIQLLISWSCQRSDNSARKNHEASGVKLSVRSRTEQTSSVLPNQLINKSPQSEEKNNKGSIPALQITPYRSIGELRIGMKLEELPEDAQNSIRDTVGVYRDIEFALEGDTVEDVWITNLRKFPQELQYKGKRVPREASIETLKAFFGTCTEAEKGRGGALFNCKGGVTLGLDCERSEGYLQMRIKPQGNFDTVIGK